MLTDDMNDVFIIAGNTAAEVREELRWVSKERGKEEREGGERKIWELRKSVPNYFPSTLESAFL